MKKFLILLALLVSTAVIGWWVVGSPHTSDATVAPSGEAAPPLDQAASGASQSAAVAADAGAPVWRSGLQSAVGQARDQGKDVLLFFTDNGPAAMESPLEAKLATADFRNRLANQFVLARFDCHPDTSVADDAAATRDIWTERLDIKSFPYLVLLDSRGRACAGVDLNKVDPSAVEATIAGLRQRRIQRDESFERAQHLSGLKQAVSLDSGLQIVKPYAQASYQQVMEQIIADDPDNEAHLREVYFPLVTQSRIDVAVQHEIYPLIDRGLFQTAIDRITQLISEESPPPDQKQLLLAFQGELFSKLGDRQTALRTLEQAVALAPDNSQCAQIKAVRDQIVNQPVKPN
jgi:tetratricopeptide (TPR) repeat protein